MTVDFVVFYYFLICYFLFGVILTLLALLLFKQVSRGRRSLSHHHFKKRGLPPHQGSTGLASSGRA